MPRTFLGPPLAMSDGPYGNLGFPSEPAGIDHFLATFNSTKQRVGEQELVTLREALESP